jgi:Mce-associated membrane protein
MADANKPPTGSPGSADSPRSKADAMALVEEAEAEAAEAEAWATAAHARARAARLRREALALAETGTETQATDDAAETDVPEQIAETVDAALPESETEPASWRRWLRTRSPLIAKAAAVVLILSLAGASGYMIWQHREASRQQQRAAAFVAGARQGVLNLTSLDFNKAKEDVQRVIDSSTGQFRDQFKERAADFAKVVQESKAITEGTVNGAAVESMDENSAKVLVSATSRVTNKVGVEEQPRTWRLRVTVADDDGQYKMAKVEFVP